MYTFVCNKMFYYRMYVLTFLKIINFEIIMMKIPMESRTTGVQKLYLS